MIADFNSNEQQPISSDEFLPPINRWITLGGLFLICTFGILLTLATVTKYNVTVKAAATVRPSGEIRIVQSALEGIIKSVNVKENQMVKQGDIIATIDDSQLQTKKSQLQGDIHQSQLRLTQIDAQIRALDLQIASETDRTKRAVVSAEADFERTQRDFQEKQVTSDSSLQEAEANIKIAQQGLQKAQAELKSAQANTKATEASLKAAIIKRNRYQTIAQSGSLSQNQLEEVQLEVTRQQQTLESQKAALESQKQVIQQQQQSKEVALSQTKRALAALHPSRAVVLMAREKIAQERAIGKANLARLQQERETLHQHQIEIHSSIITAQKDLKQVETELEKTIIRTLEAGTILKLELRNRGQVVRPGEGIAQIAPSKAPLVIKAHVESQDIGNVRVCKTIQVADCQDGKVLLQISAYPYPDYGTLQGAVRAITADIITQPNNSTIASTNSYYEVTIEPEKVYLEKANQSYFIQPGMEVKADIISQQETFLMLILRRTRLFSNI